MKRRAASFACLLLFLGLSILHTWPLASAPSRLAIGMADTLVGLWSVNDLARQILHGPARPFDGSIFYPYPNTLAVVDHQTVNALCALLLRPLAREPVLVYNLLVMLGFTLTGFFAYVLLVETTGSAIAGLVAGCAFAFSPFRFNHLVHMHLLTTQWAVLGLVALHRFLRMPAWRSLVFLVCTGVLTALTSWYVAILGALLFSMVAVWTLFSDGRPIGRRVVMLAGATAIVGACVVPIARAYLDLARQFARPETHRADRPAPPALAAGAIPIEGVVLPPARSRAPYAFNPRPDLTGESRAFPGVMPLLGALAAVALVRTRPRRHTTIDRTLMAIAGLALGIFLIGIASAAFGFSESVFLWLSRRVVPLHIFTAAALVFGLRHARQAGRLQPDGRVVVTYACVAIVGLVLSFGARAQVAGIDVAAGVFKPASMAGMVRAPARFSMLFALAVAILAGIGVEFLTRKLPRAVRYGVVALVLILLNLDLRVAPIKLVAVPRLQAVHRWLAETREPGAVIEYPNQGNDWIAYTTLQHGRRTVNGGGFIVPPLFTRIDFGNPLSEEQIELLWEYFHPRFVVVRGSLMPPADRARIESAIAARPDALRIRTRFGRDRVYQLIDRGVGAHLDRRWPREALAGSRGFQFVGQVGPVEPDVINVLEAALNGQSLGTPEGERSVVPTPRFARIRPEQLVAGINTLQLRANYRFGPNGPANSIGATNVRLTADVDVSSGREGATVQVNARTFRVVKGYLLVVVSPETGEIDDVARFNTTWYEADSAALARFVERLARGKVVVVGSEFDVARRLTPAAVRALQTSACARICAVDSGGRTRRLA
ncbi:MAG: hypothetical protein HYX76_11335 [Acidobacteria bacterium]|nr:hypothetical protein [Acidobacteriota bacterium]